MIHLESLKNINKLRNWTLGKFKTELKNLFFKDCEQKKK